MSIVDFQGTVINAFASPDLGNGFISKLNKCGQQKFFKLAGGGSLEQGLSVAPLNCGVVVAGNIRTSDIGPYDFNGDLVSGLIEDGGLYVSRLCGSGVQKFFKTAGMGVEIQVTTIKNDCIFVAGSMDPTIDFNGNYLGSYNSSFVAKLDSCGVQKYFKTANNNTPFGLFGSLHVDCCENAYVTGSIFLENAVDFAGNPIITGSTGTAIYVAKLDKTGKQIYFTLATQGPSNSFILNHAIDSKCGNAYVTGQINSNGTDFSGNVIDQVNPNQLVTFIARLDKCGNQKFFKIAGGDGSFGTAIRAHKTGIIVTGRLNPPYNDFDGVIQSGYGFGDIFITNIDKRGNQKFFKLSGGADSELGESLGINNENIYITGVLGSGGYDFANNLVNTSGNSRVFVAKLKMCGSQTYYKIAGGTDGNTFESKPNSGIKLAVDRCDCVYVTGLVTKNQDPIFDFENNQIIESFTNEDSLIFVAKLDKNGCQKFFKIAGGTGNLACNIGVDIVIGCNGIYLTGTVENR